MRFSHLRDHIIRPALHLLAQYKSEMNTPSAINLLMGIAAQETNGGVFLHQINGPALGIYQMEPRTHRDIWDTYILPRNKLWDTVLLATTTYGKTDREAELMYNHLYATVMARLHLWRCPEPLPHHENIWALGAYWKLHWNTEGGKGTVEQFVDNYSRYTGH